MKSDRKIVVQCKVCQGRIRLQAGRSGIVKCGHCGENFFASTMSIEKNNDELEKYHVHNHDIKKVSAAKKFPLYVFFKLCMMYFNKIKYSLKVWINILSIFFYKIINSGYSTIAFTAICVVGLLFYFPPLNDRVTGRESFRPENSSFIEMLLWSNSDSGTMTVYFKPSGQVYRYIGVSKQEYNSLINSKSIGSAFNAKIRPNFDCYDYLYFDDDYYDIDKYCVRIIY